MKFTEDGQVIVEPGEVVNMGSFVGGKPNRIYRRDFLFCGMDPIWPFPSDSFIEAPSPEECAQALEVIEGQATPEARQPGLVAEVHQTNPISAEACARATKSLCG